MKKTNIILISHGLIIFFISSYVMYELKALFLPFTVAVLFSILFYPLMITLKKNKIPLAISLFTVILIFAISFLLLGFILYTSAEPLVKGLPAYQVKLNQIIQNVSLFLSSIVKTFGFQIGDIDIKTLLGATAVTADALSTTLKSFVDFLSKAGLVILFMLFMLSGSLDLHHKIRKAYPHNISSKINLALNNIGEKVRRFLVTKIILSGSIGLLTMLILWILGVDFPVFWGFVAFLFSFVPQIGPLISVGFPVIFSILQYDDLTIPVLVLISLSILFMIAVNIIQPKIMAEALNLSPLLVLVGLVFWGLLWGIWGMILAIPLTTTIKIIFENIEPLKPISVLMGAKTD